MRIAVVSLAVRPAANFLLGRFLLPGLAAVVAGHPVWEFFVSGIHRRRAGDVSPPATA